MKNIIKIKHRVHEISSIDNHYGAEIDVRYHHDDLIISHDPFHHHESSPLLLEQFLQHYSSSHPLVLNIKTEGIEQSCIDLMNKYSITNWFFLDLSMPFFVRYANAAFDKSIKSLSSHNLAVRFSESEPIEYALSFRDKAAWVWVDCFTKMPLDATNYKLLKKHFKICLVSPELQNKPIETIAIYIEMLGDMEIDAVCTKRPDLW